MKIQIATVDASVERALNLTNALPAYRRYGFYQMPASDRTLRRIQARQEAKQRAKQAKVARHA